MFVMFYNVSTLNTIQIMDYVLNCTVLDTCVSYDNRQHVVINVINE